MKLKHILLTGVVAGSFISLLISCNPKKPSQEIPLADYVSTLVGTQSDFSFSNGNTYPAVALPWGMNFWTPQTGKMGNGWTYTYTAKKIVGLKQTHQPSPWINDYGQFSIMPIIGTSKISDEQRASYFSHKAEVARPYYYSVYLADYDITAELAPTDRSAIFRFTYPECDSSSVLIDAFDQGSYVCVQPELQRIIGYTTKNSGGVPDNFKNYFVVEFDKPFQSMAVYRDGKAVDCLQGEGNHMMALVSFATEKGEQVSVKAASSFISQDQAMVNLQEIQSWSFDKVKEDAKTIWNETLGRIHVEGGNLDQYRTFYSCLYRCLLFPRKFYEVAPDGSIYHYSPYNGRVCEGYLFTDTGFWDTFRALFPLLNLVYPSVNTLIQEGLVNVARENDFLPEWASPGHRDCMIGNNSASVVADAAVKEIGEHDLELLYHTLQHGTTHVHPHASSSGRLGHEYYNAMGYIPYDVGINENVARTLEYAYNDWSLLQLAKKLGRPREELAILEARCQNYRNVFDTETGLMRGRNADGTFQVPFNPYKWGDAFTEGNSWHYTFSVFHDIQGLIDIMGGDKQFVALLDSVFIVPPIYDDSYYGYRIHEILEMQVMNMGNYAHGNQPIQHMIYLYNYAGQPWKAQQHVRSVMNRLYTPAPDGYCGDEDNGQTSAWYVLSALGFYSVCPGSDEYVLGVPLFKKATLHLENGNRLVLSAPDNSHENMYIGEMRINGKKYSHNFLKYHDLIKGGHIKFDMVAQPNYGRGIHKEDRPYSYSNSSN